MVSHRNVVNFVHGMDARVNHDEPATFLAVTSVSFDISVLELFWTLARGFRVVVYTGADAERQPAGAARTTTAPDFSLFFFASGERDRALERYRLLTEAVKFADSRGFSAVWTPERHFHAFGGPVSESVRDERRNRCDDSPGEDPRRQRRLPAA